MARNPKVGLDYFRLDVHLDDKFELIEAEFGLRGFAVVVKLYQKIYGECGYYCEWDEDVALVFGRKVGLGASAVSEIVNAAIRRKLFDAGMYEKYHILTSSGVQKWYFEAAARRDRVEAISEYLLVDYAHLPKNVYINRVSADINSIYAGRNTQSKAKESKGKESTSSSGASGAAPDLTQIEPGADAGWTAFAEEYHRNFGELPRSIYELEDLQHYFDALGAQVMNEAIRVTALRHPDNPSPYLRKVCKSWLRKGVSTPEQARAEAEAYSRRTGGRAESDRRMGSANPADYAAEDDFYPY